MTTFTKLRSNPLTILRPSLVALTLASLALGCANRSNEQPQAECVMPTASKGAPASLAQPATSPPALAVPATPVVPAVTEKVRPPSRAPNQSALVVKRFVVAADVREREPLTISELPMDTPRVYAFAELQNPGSEPEQIRITFERKGGRESVGHATLAIPASVSRHRTWATSRHVHTPGSWEAVLWSESGAELGRTAFEVTETKSPAAT